MRFEELCRHWYVEQWPDSFVVRGVFRCAEDSGYCAGDDLRNRRILSASNHGGRADYDKVVDFDVIEGRHIVCLRVELLDCFEEALLEVVFDSLGFGVYRPEHDVDFRVVVLEHFSDTLTHGAIKVLLSPVHVFLMTDHRL